MSQMAPDIREALRERLRERLRQRVEGAETGAVETSPPERGIGLAAGKGLEAGTYGAGGNIARMAQAAQAFEANPVRSLLAGGGRMMESAGESLATNQVTGERENSIQGAGAGGFLGAVGGLMRGGAESIDRAPMNPEQQLKYKVFGGAADYLGGKAEIARAQMPTMAHEPFSREWFAAGIAETAPQMVGSILATIGGTAAGGPVGGMAAGAAVMFPLEAGAQAEETFKTLVQQGVDPEDALAESFVPAVAYGLASAGVEQGGVQSAVRSGMLRGSIKERIVAAVRGLPGMAGQEAGEEAVQGNIGRAVGGALTGEGPALLSGENAMLSAQEAALGGAAGLVFGGAVGAGQVMGGRRNDAQGGVTERNGAQGAGGQASGQTPPVDQPQTESGPVVTPDTGADTTGAVDLPQAEAVDQPAPPLEVGTVAGPKERYGVAASLASRALRSIEGMEGPQRREVAQAVARRFRDSTDDITPETVAAAIGEELGKSAVIHPTEAGLSGTGTNGDLSGGGVLGGSEVAGTGRPPIAVVEQMSEAGNPPPTVRDELGIGRAEQGDRDGVVVHTPTLPPDTVPGEVTTVPEKPETLALQLADLTAGKRAAVLVTPGEAMPSAENAPARFKRINTKAGRFIFDPEKTTAGEIRKAVKENRIGDVLGYGVAAKPEPGTEIGAVTVRTPEGIERQAVVVDEAGLPAAMEAAQRVAGEGDTIRLEEPRETIERRMEEPDLTDAEMTANTEANRTEAERRRQEAAAARETQEARSRQYNTGVRWEEAKAERNRKVPIAGPKSDEYVVPKGGVRRVIARTNDAGRTWEIYDPKTRRVIDRELGRVEAWNKADEANTPAPAPGVSAAQPTAGPAPVRGGPGQGAPVGVAQDAVGRVPERATRAGGTEDTSAPSDLQRMTDSELATEAAKVGVKPSPNRLVTEKRIGSKREYLARINAGQMPGETAERRDPAESARAALRPGWKLESVSESGSAYLVHKTTGQIVRVADHHVPETFEGRAARQPWAEEVISRIGPTVEQVRKAMDAVEREAAEARLTQETTREEGDEEGRQGPSVPPVTATPTTTPAPAARATGKGLKKKGAAKPDADIAKMSPADWEAVRRGDLAGKLRPVNRADGAPDAIPAKKPEAQPAEPGLFEQIAASARERRKKRTIPRGRSAGSTTIILDTIDVAVEVAAKAAGATVRGGKALYQIIDQVIKDRQSKADRKAVARVAKALLAESEKDGKIEPELFERAIDNVYADADSAADRKRERTKARIEKLTGVKREEPKTITPSKALSGAYRAAQRAAAKGYREGVRLTMIEARDRMNALRKLARGKDATEKGIRQELVRLVEDTLPPSLQGKFLAAASRVKTLAQLQHQIRRLRDKLADYRLRLGMKDLRRALKRASKMKMLDENKAAIADAAAAERRFTDVYTKRMKTGEKVKLIEAVLAEYRKVEETMANQRASEKVRIGTEWWAREEIVTKAVQLIDDHKADLKAVSGLSHDARASLIGRANQAMLTPDGVGALLIDPKLRQLLSEDNWIGETEVFKGTQAWEDRKKELLEAAGYEWGSDRTQKLSAAVSRDKADVVKIKLPDAGEIEGTPAEMMALFGTLTDLRAGRQIENGTPISWGRNRLGTPIRLSPTDVAAFKAGLDPKLKAIVNAGKEFVEQRIRPGVFRAHRQLKGWDLDAVPGYYRTGRNMKQADPARTDTLKDWDGWAQQALTGLGFLKQRVPSSQTPYVIGDFFDDMNEMVHKGLVFTHMGPRVRTMTIVFNDPRLQSTIERKYGAGLLRQIDDTIHAAKLIFKEPADQFERFASFTARMYARAVLTLNPRTWMKQLGGIAKIANEIDPKIVAAAIAALRDPTLYKATRAEMLADPWFRERYQEAVWRRVTPALGERVPLLGPTKTTDAMRRLLKLSPGAAGELIDRIEILNWFDMQAAMVAWEAAKRVHGGDRAAAARTAQFAFRRTQNTSSPLDMSGVALRIRGKVSSLAIIFTSDANKSYNILSTAIASRDPKKIGRAAAAVSINAAWAAVVVAMFGELKDLGEDDEKKRKLFIARWSDSFARDLAGMGYFGGDAYDFAKLAVTAAVTGKMPSMWQFEQGLQNPIVSNVLDTADALLSLFSAPGADGYMQSGPNRYQSKRWVYFKRFLSKGASAAGKWFGIPYEPPMRVINDLLRAGKRAARKLDD